MKNRIGLLKFKKIIAIVCVISSSCMFLSGCHVQRYSEDEANKVIEMGTAVMKDWISKNCPNGKIVEIDHYDYICGPSYLTDYATGTMNDGHTDRGFAVNIKTGAVWLKPDDDMWEEFIECSKEYYLKSLDLPSDTIFDDDNFRTSLCFSTIREDSNGSWADGYFEYHGLPGELVLQNGDVKEYVNDPNRDATIFYYCWSDQLPESFVLESYTFNDLYQRQEQYNIKFDYIVLENGYEQISYSHLSSLFYEKWDYEEVGDVLLKNRSVYRITTVDHEKIETNEYTFNAQDGVQIEKIDDGYRIIVDPEAKNVKFQLMVKAGNPMLDNEYKIVLDSGSERYYYWDECEEGFRLENDNGVVVNFYKTTDLIVR